MKYSFGSKGKFVCSMAIFGTLGVFVRSISVSSGELALYRALLATAMLGLVLLVTKNKIRFSEIKKELALLILSGVAMGLNWVLLFQAYRYTTVSVATLSYYFAPVIVTLICPIMFKEKMTGQNWICFAMSTLGLVLITGLGDLSVGANHRLGILYGLGAACLYATVILINKNIRQVNGIHRTFLQFAASLLILVPYVLCTGGFSIGTLDKAGWLCLLIVGLIHTGANYCLYFSSLKDLSGHHASILSYIDPLVAILVSFLILQETMTLMQIFGGLLILGFTLWNEFPQKLKKPKRNSHSVKKHQ